MRTNASKWSSARVHQKKFEISARYGAVSLDAVRAKIVSAIMSQDWSRDKIIHLKDLFKLKPELFDPINNCYLKHKNYDG